MTSPGSPTSTPNFRFSRSVILVVCKKSHSTNRGPQEPSRSHRVPPNVSSDLPHPFTSRRIVDLPRCAVCSTPTIFSCERCSGVAYYCKPKHFIELRGYWLMLCDLTSFLGLAPTPDGKLGFRGLDLRVAQSRQDLLVSGLSSCCPS